jgi:YbgC/YbaW family acyl-CoA thioester hydrolase
MEKFLKSFYSIRFSDCDPFRHLNNARYIDYFMNAREDHLRDHYKMDLATFYKNGTGWVVTAHEIAYLKPASFNEKVCIQTGLLQATADQLLVEMLMLNEKETELKAILHTLFTPVSLTTGKREAHSPSFMDFLSDKMIIDPSENTAPLSERLNIWLQKVRLLPTPIN